MQAFLRFYRHAITQSLEKVMQYPRFEPENNDFLTHLIVDFQTGTYLQSPILLDLSRSLYSEYRSFSKTLA
jgi:hypothetical protein